MNKSESIKAISPALLKAQKAITAATKGATNPFYKSKYADLESVIDACKKPLNDNGISVLQSVGHFNGEKTFIETVLLHESGEFLSNTMIVTMDKEGPQAQGTAISYARRYSIQSFIFLPAEDDDAESATDRKKKTPAKKIKPITKLQREELEDIAKKLPVKDAGKLNNWLKGKKTSFDGALKSLEHYREVLASLPKEKETEKTEEEPLPF